MTNAFKNLTIAKQITNRKLKYRKFSSQRKKKTFNLMPEITNYFYLVE